MPVMLRSFYLGKLIDVKERKRREIADAANPNSTEAPSAKISRGPAISPRQ